MAALYLRLSKEDEDLLKKSDKLESNSIANQEALILKELKSMTNVTFYDIYIEMKTAEIKGFRQIKRVRKPLLVLWMV